MVPSWVTAGLAGDDGVTGTCCSTGLAGDDSLVSAGLMVERPATGFIRLVVSDCEPAMGEAVAATGFATSRSFSRLSFCSGAAFLLPLSVLVSNDFMLFLALPSRDVFAYP